jgi:hypothetical protein
MCGSVRQRERQCAVVRTARTARGTARQCAAVAIIVVILQPPCFATNCCYNDTASPVLRNNYYYNARVIYGSAGGPRTGHVRICGWSTDGPSTDLRVVYGYMGGYRVVYGLSVSGPWSTNWTDNNSDNCSPHRRCYLCNNNNDNNNNNDTIIIICSCARIIQIDNVLYCSS